jgi:hypothetical protein
MNAAVGQARNELMTQGMEIKDPPAVILVRQASGL